MENKEKLKKLGIKIPEILIPDREKTDYEKWSVIACDQFTSNREYWDDVKKLAGSSPSALNLILPECYLKDIKIDKTLLKINSTMDKYVKSGVLKKTPPGFVLVERETPYTPSRQGLLIAVDLEKYDYSEFADSLIRPTEKTVVDRLPPRIKIRENASLDLPHILFLIDDPDNTVVEYLYKKRNEFQKLYDFRLMKNGGQLRGWLIDSQDEISSLADAFQKLSERNKTLFAVGDGNHSLAAAKEVWNIIKKKPGIPENHPARYALVEIININSSGLNFEPIHRIVFDTDSKSLLDDFIKSTGCEAKEIEKERAVTPHQPDRIIFASSTAGYREIKLKNEKNLLAAEKLQSFLDLYLKDNHDKIDYIHGEKDLLDLAGKKGNTGFMLPVIDKKTFFKHISEKGVFPRKTFSIGESIEKRYYLESRIIKE